MQIFGQIFGKKQEKSAVFQQNGSFWGVMISIFSQKSSKKITRNDVYFEKINPNKPFWMILSAALCINYYQKLLKSALLDSFW